MGLSYDRRVPEELLKALEPGGFAHSLVEFGGSGMWALDLQLRGLGEAKKQHRATLYVGTTKVVDLHLKGQSFALSAHPTFACEANGWVAAWAQWHHDRWFADRWAEVDNYLQVVIEKIVRAGTYVKEGMVQAALGRFPSTDFTVIDREATQSNRAVGPRRNSGRRAHQGAPSRRTRPQSRSKREREAGGGVRASGLRRSCNGP